jgi:hypothetical protein
MTGRDGTWRLQMRIAHAHGDPGAAARADHLQHLREPVCDSSAFTPIAIRLRIRCASACH